MKKFFFYKKNSFRAHVIVFFNFFSSILKCFLTALQHLDLVENDSIAPFTHFICVSVLLSLRFFSYILIGSRQMPKCTLEI